MSEAIATTPVAYATPVAGNGPTIRLLTLTLGALGFMFLGGCFCIGLLYLIAMYRFATQSSNDASVGQVLLATVLSAMALVCFVTSIGFIVTVFRHQRAAR